MKRYNPHIENEKEFLNKLKDIKQEFLTDAKLAEDTGDALSFMDAKARCDARIKALKADVKSI